MRLGKRQLAGLLTASLLFPVPALAVHQKLTHTIVSPRQTTKPGQATAAQLVNHQAGEREQYKDFKKALNAEFRGSDSNTRASVHQVIKDTLKNLKQHWRLETRTKTIASTFSFPTI